jgi:glycosyltransferase involved in cell wall biosynthesis
MNVLYPYSRTSVGGAVVSGALAAGPLRDVGVACEGVFPGEGPAVDVFRRRGIPVHIEPQHPSALRALRGTSTTAGKLRAVPALLKRAWTAHGHLRRHIPDIVHVNGDQAIWTWGLPARMLGIPVVWHVRQENGTPWMDRLRARISSYVVFVADANRVRFENVEPLPPHRTIYNCVDLERFHPPADRAKQKQRFGLPAESVTVGFVGNMVARKRPAWAVRAALDLRAAGHDLELVLVGADYDNGGRRIALEREAEQAGAAAHVCFLGYREDVVDLMRAMDVLVLPSVVNGEAFPRVIIEAMASGAAVVATDVAGISEAVDDGRSGLLAHPRCYADFRDQLERAVKDAALRERLARNARETVAARFTPDSVRDQIAEVYEQLVGESAENSI